MVNPDKSIVADVEAVSRISIVPKLLEVICRTTGMGFAAIARVTENSWVACSVRDEILFGLRPGGELKLETTICNDIRQNQKAVIINHVEKDATYASHHTPLLYGFQSYISVPIIKKDGSFFGTLCSIDPRPAQLNTPETIGMFTLFAELIAFHLHAIEELQLSETKLEEERQTAELREQFIAILGHDLRNPVTAVYSSAQVLLQMPLDAQVMKLAGIIKNSSYRMTGLIENMLDFARGRLGDGITLNYKKHEPIEQIVKQVITELLAISPGKAIDANFNLLQPVACDGPRIAQLFSNVLSNAIAYGAIGTPVKVKAASENGLFTLSVSNAGNKIPQATMEKLFHPFSRGEAEPGQQGLGLGLYIASEIAAAHKGAIKAESTDSETCFTLQIPSQQV